MNDSSRSTVGYIGLGTMGAPMALNLLKAGYRVVVNDIRREAAAVHVQSGAIWADTPRALAEQCEIVFSCLPSLDAIETVALGEDGVCAGVRPATAFFEMSTSTRELVKRLHASFAERGAHMLDAPVTGGAKGAEDKRLSIYVGGDEAVFQRHEPVLKAIAEHPMYVGELGAGLIVKLIHNCAIQTTQAAIAEGFILGVKAGIDPLKLWRALRQSLAGRRRTFDDLFAQFLIGEYDRTTAPLWIVLKDMRGVTELALDLGVPLRFAHLALADIQEAANRGWSNRDVRSVMLLPQERVGVDIKVEPVQIDEVLRADPPAPSDVKFGVVSQP